MKVRRSRTLSVGIIGGLGPQTSAELYLRLVRSPQVVNAPYRPRIVLGSVALPYDLEAAAILHAERLPELPPILADEARRLEAAGVSFIVLACVSLHLFIEEIRAAVSVPVVSVVEECLTEIALLPAPRVAVLGTDITERSRLFLDALAHRRIPAVLLNPVDQLELSRHIHEIVIGGPSTECRQFLRRLIRWCAAMGATHVVLGCTDLQLAVDKAGQPLQVLDCFEILANAVVRELLSTENSVFNPRPLEPVDAAERATDKAIM